MSLRLSSGQPLAGSQNRTHKRASISTLTKPFGQRLTPILPSITTRPTITSTHQQTTPMPDIAMISGNRFRTASRREEDEDVLFRDADIVENSIAASKQQSEKLAEFEIEHNWLLKEETEKRYKQFERRRKLLTIQLPDEDPLEGINNRLEEIHSMVKPKIELLDFLGHLNQEQKDRVLSVSKFDSKSIVQERRKHWKVADYLRYAFKMVFAVTCAANASRRYFYPEEPEAGPSIMRKQRVLHRRGSQVRMKSNLSFELQNILMTNSNHRTEDHIKKVLWLLKTTKAFHNLFPSEMTTELAKAVVYERYDDNRHIAYQGRLPDRLYFVITGKIQKLKEYKLPSGCLNKLMGVLQKGDMSDFEELESHGYRQEHLVSSGPVEVLILAKQDYMRLLHTTQGIPVEFLLSIDLFKEFPAETFTSNESSISYKYYGQNKVICPDVHKTQWLHIVKSGKVQLVRHQNVFDTMSDMLFQDDKDEPGLGRTYFHAKTMLGNLDSQRRLRDSNISLPQLMRRRSKPNEKAPKKSKLRESTEESLEMTTIAESKNLETLGESANEAHKTPEKDFSLPAIVVNGPVFRASRLVSPEIKLKGPWSKRSQLSAKESKEWTNHGTDPLPDISKSSAINPVLPRTFLTRDKTSATDIIPTSSYRTRPKKEVPLRKTCVQLDVLKPGDVFILGLGQYVNPFCTVDVKSTSSVPYETDDVDVTSTGLEDIAQKLRYEQTESDENMSSGDLPSLDTATTLSLVSDGAEVIKISKRFFLRHARNNTMLRVEIMQRSYLSPEETTQALYTKESWCQYKEALMKKILSSLVR